MSSRTYPQPSCDFYIEKYVPIEQIPRHHHRLRRNQSRNPVGLFRDIENPERESSICSWGNTEVFNRTTNWSLSQSNYIGGSRVRPSFHFPVPGRRGWWKFNQVGPCKMFRMPLSDWTIQPFLDDFRVRLSKSLVHQVEKKQSQVQEDNSEL